MTTIALPPGWERWNSAEKARLLETLKTARDARMPRDPVGWAHGHGLHLWSKQREVARSVEANKRTAVRAGHAVGKTYDAAMLTGWWVTTRPDGLVVTTAPSAAQVSGVLWEEIRGLHQSLKLPGEATLSDRWRVGAKLMAFGRKPPDQAKGSDFDPATFQGYHRVGGVLVILDEADGIPAWLWTAAETITTSDNSRILAIGNPQNASSPFAEVCAPGKPGWHQIRISVFDTPAFTGEEVPDHVLAALVPRSWPAERAEDWGEDNPLYVARVLAEFPKADPRQIVHAGELAACWLADVLAADALLPVELGVDVGGGGDMTIIRERRGIRAARRWAERTPAPEQAGRMLAAAILETGASSVKIDANGVGWGLAGEIRNMQARGDLPRHVQVHAVMVGTASAQPLKYANLRAEIWWEVGRGSCQQRTWQLDANDPANGQLLIPRWLLDAKGRILVESKNDIRSRTGGRSPDDADALLLAFYVPRDAQAGYFGALTGGKLGR